MREPTPTRHEPTRHRMKPLLFKIRSNRAADAPPPTADDNLGRGMDIALTLAVFLGLGWLLDRWLGVFPLFTIVFVLLAAVGQFIRLRYTYEATMQRLEAERAAQRSAQSGGRGSRLEDVA